MVIGILALQGAFIEHKNMLDELHIDSFEIRNLNDLLKDMDGIILPGGESTTMGKLLHDLGMFELLQAKIQNGLPVLGTCAGMILLSSKIDKEDQVHLGVMDIVVSRNAFGRQLGSFNTQGLFNGVSIPMTFIRAPYIIQTKKGIVLSYYQDKITAVRQSNMLATAFHPELTNDYTVHNYFIDMVNDSIKATL